MRETVLPAVRSLPLFRSMADENFLVLTRGAYDQTFPPQIQLIDEGASADFLHIVVEGSIELFASWQGRETTLAVVRPLSTFILAACMQDAPYLMSARTLEKTRLILVPSSDVRTIFRTDCEFALATIAELSAGYRGMVRHAKGLKLRSARERLAAYLLRQAEDGGDRASFVLPMEKRVLASFLGMTPESLSRAMKSLQADGAVVDGQRVIITDRPALQALAQPSRLIDGPDEDVLIDQRTARSFEQGSQARGGAA
ncbi:MAG TPA: helix-turn-helix domain-containing protein [Aurantimonas sp.]|uniref:Helix-turn-helix domain-containing protein n=1 Tax=Aurantimonas marianensis TaxID=2920428 RepID=A0A9X2KEL5_9HYPH|nr:helix-turn-helix domain-containing protein [Aurantimonas marianensis]MCP3054581.1 helix-turn-helix domain-containing protein [Aurantimonas marianensis]